MLGVDPEALSTSLTRVSSNTTPEPPFVGREDEIATLQAAWRKAKAGTPTFVLLLGEPQLGKTRVVQEFYRWLSAHEDPAGYWPVELPHRGASLSVNPEFEVGRGRTAGTMPWLWWGLRWSTPDRRNQPESRGSAVLDDLHHLEPHLATLVRRRAERGALTDVMKTAAATLVSMLPFCGAVGGLKDVAEAVSKLLDVQRARQKAEQRVRTYRHEETAGAFDKVLSFLQQLAGTPALTPNGLPVILVLDDAQWADRESLQLLSAVCRAAHAAQPRWRLLIIATHWEQEWNQRSNAALVAADQVQPADLCRLLGTTGWEENKTLIVRRLAPLPDLRSVVATALPGLPAAQLQMVVDKAGGNPGLLDQIVAHVRALPEVCFHEEKRDGALTGEAVAQLRETKFDLNQLAQERFHRLGREIRDVLGLGGYLGVRFPRELVLELARRVFADLQRDPAAAEPSLARADNPYVVVQRSRPGELEFRQPVYHTVATEYLALSPKTRDRLHGRLRDLLRERLAPEHFELLSPSEQEALARLAWREFQGAANGTDAGREDAVVAAGWLVSLLDEQGRVRPLESAWCDFWSCAQADLAAAVGRLSDTQLFGVVAAARRLAQLEPALGLADAWVARARATADATQSLLDALTARGRVHRDSDRLGAALGDYDEAIALARQQCDASGAHAADSRHDLAALLVGLGEIHRACDRVDPAAACYAEALELQREAVRAGQASAADRQNLSATLSHVGTFHFEGDRFEAAQQCHAEARQLAQQLITDFGASADRLSGWVTCLRNLGEVHRRLGRVDEADACCTEALAVARKVVTDYSPSVQRLGSLSSCLGSVGAIAMDREQGDRARDAAAEAYTIDLELIREFGVSAERLSAAYAGATNAGVHSLLTGRFDVAAELYDQALAIARLLLRDFGATVERQLWLGHALGHAGLLHHHHGRPREAHACYTESLELARRLVAEDERSAERLDNLLNRLMDWARWCEVERDLPGALATLREAVTVSTAHLEVAPDRAAAGQRRCWFEAQIARLEGEAAGAGSGTAS